MASPLFNVTTTTLGEVNLRSTPRLMSDNIIQTIPSAASLEVGGSSRDWLYVRSGAQAGYLSASLVNEFHRSTLAWTCVVVDTDTLNVRAGPSTDQEVVGVLEGGDAVTVLGCGGKWLRVLHKGGIAYIRASYAATLDLPQASTGPAPAPAPGRLTISELRDAHLRISALSDETARGDRYEALQSRVPYYSQRDNESRAGDGTLVETVKGAMCNLTALAMALSYLGFDNPHPEMQYEDALERVRVDKGLPKRSWTTGWGGVARAVGADVVFVRSSDFRADRHWWESTVRPVLRAGQPIIMSITGHIVRLQAVTDAGLVVDDPYGWSELTAGSGWTFDKVNPYQAPGTVVGDDVLWPWDDVSKHTMHWVAGLRVLPEPEPNADPSSRPTDPSSRPTYNVHPDPAWTPIPEISDEGSSNPFLHGIRSRRQLMWTHPLTPQEATLLRPG